MKHIFLTLILGSVLVIIFDTLASLISFHFQVSYGLFIIGSIFIYAYIGFYCARYGGLLWSAVGAAIIGAVDSTLGWYVAWAIGPGRTDNALNYTEILVTIIFIASMAIPVGLIGGLFYRLLNRRAV